MCIFVSRSALAGRCTGNQSDHHTHSWDVPCKLHLNIKHKLKLPSLLFSLSFFFLFLFFSFSFSLSLFFFLSLSFSFSFFLFLSFSFFLPSLENESFPDILSLSKAPSSSSLGFSSVPSGAFFVVCVCVVASKS